MIHKNVISKVTLSVDAQATGENLSVQKLPLLRDRGTKSEKKRSSPERDCK